MINAVVGGCGCCDRERAKKLKSKFSHDACVDVAFQQMRDNYHAAALRRQSSHKSVELYHSW